jgi:hypothetical protein
MEARRSDVETISSRARSLRLLLAWMRYTDDRYDGGLRPISALVSGGHRNTTSMMGLVDVGGRCGAGDEVER